jgi:phosphatidylserine/phosphatidylglycerophosphate/cardiolipin synthase-like enzyme
MRAAITNNGLTLRVIAGTHSAILAIDLQENKRKGCLGFSLLRTDLGPVGKPLPAAKQTSRWLPNMLRFPTDKSDGPVTTETAPLQKFRWGDYTLQPASRYRFQLVPRYGKPGSLTTRPELAGGVTVEATTEDPEADETQVYFNRAAAASRAFELEFPQIKTENQLLADTDEARKAKAWLSNGLEEAVLTFLARAKDKSYALHAAIYEFQKPELLAGLKAAAGRGAEVHVAYHHRKKNADDKTAKKNDDAVKAAGFGSNVRLVRRGADPQDAIMHNKFVVLLQKEEGGLVPQAVWTGSTNWTDGGLYGQLNVGHAVHDKSVAAAYERYFQLLFEDADAETMKHELAALTPVSVVLPGEHKITPIFSPQSADTMLHLYSSLCDGAKCVMVSAPFALSPIVLAALAKKREDVLRYMLLDKEASLGKGEEVHVIEGDPSNVIAAATTLSSPLHDFQGKLLEGKESFRHAGIHIHSKIILVDPLGSDPILVTGSANFSRNSTEVNDSNSLVIRGHTAVADIYLTEFMRMFEQYHFRASVAAAGGKLKSKPLGLHADDTWSDKYYVKDSTAERDRRMFAGTH